MFAVSAAAAAIAGSVFAQDTFGGGRLSGAILVPCEPGDELCRVLDEKTKRLQSRNPVAEARAALAKGDYRLGAVLAIDPIAPGWRTVGVECSVWTRVQIGKWHVFDDVRTPAMIRHTEASIRFLSAYNQALVEDPKFPYPDYCAVEGKKPSKKYTGKIGNLDEAVRSGEVAQVETMAAKFPDQLNMRNLFGQTPLTLAMSRGEEPTARALLERGADPNLRYRDLDLESDTGAAPLARALSQGRFELARLMLAKGARMTGQTGLCDWLGRRALADLTTAEGPKNRKCSWAGLLIATGQFDLLDQQAAAGALDRPVRDIALQTYSETEKPDPVVAIDEEGELQAAFFDAVAHKDEAVAGRLLRHVGHNQAFEPQVFERLLQLKRVDLARTFILSRGSAAARSEAEADLWRLAAAAGQDDALAFLYDFGGNLNLLPQQQLIMCQALARTGDVAGLAGCVRSAATRRTAMKAALDMGEFAKFDALAAEAADVKERNKRTLIELAAERAPASTLGKLLSRGAAPRTFGYSRLTRVYAGPFRTEAEATSAPDPGPEPLSRPPIIVVAQRGDVECLKLLVDAGSKVLAMDVFSAAKVGYRTPGLSTDFNTDVDDDSERYPNRADPESLVAVSLLAAEAARAGNAQSLESTFESAVYSGYNDVLEALLSNGFDARKAKRPELIWSNVAGFDEPCKPSTIQILLRAGLPTTYPPNAWTRLPPLHSIAARCRNPKSAAVLAAAVDVNLISVDGQTALDVAIQYRQTRFAAALRALGGKTAKEVDPHFVAAREQAARETNDLDLQQSVAK